MKVLPELDAVNTDFWTGGFSGELRIARCRDCSHFIHPPQPICPKCMSLSVASNVMSGKAIIDSFTINHQAWSEGMKTPYVIVVVKLLDAPNVRITAQLVDCDPQSVEIGQSVFVDFKTEDDVSLPVFRIANLTTKATH